MDETKWKLAQKQKEMSVFMKSFVESFKLKNFQKVSGIFVPD